MLIWGLFVDVLCVVGVSLLILLVCVCVLLIKLGADTIILLSGFNYSGGYLAASQHVLFTFVHSVCLIWFTFLE